MDSPISGKFSDTMIVASSDKEWLITAHQNLSAGNCLEPPLAIGKKKPEKTMASTGFEPVTLVIPVRCSTNSAIKPHIGSEFSLLSSYLP